MLSFYLQCPPTGLFPQAQIENTDLSWVYEFDGWKSVTSRGGERRISGWGTEPIPDVLISGTIGQVGSAVRRIIGERPSDGCIGIWSRGTCLLRTNDPKVFVCDLLGGFFWHPDPHALAYCKAQERLERSVAMMQDRFKEPNADLIWRPLGLEHLLGQLVKMKPSV